MTIAAFVISIIAALGAAAAAYYTRQYWEETVKQTKISVDALSEIRIQTDRAWEAVRESQRQGDIADEALEEAKRQGKITETMKDLASEEQKANLDRWLAANKPFIRITFPDKLVWGNKRLLFEKKVKGAPLFIGLSNVGLLPCRLTHIELEGLKFNPTLEVSTFREGRIAGFLEGCNLVPNETQFFRSIDIKNQAEANHKHNGTHLLLILKYEYAPKREVVLKYTAFTEGQRDTHGATWIDLVIIENTRDYKEPKVGSDTIDSTK